MACLTDEQLAQLALGMAAGEPPAGHVAECAACQARLAELGRLTDQLAAAHGELDRTHAAARDRLLTAVVREPRRSERVGLWRGLSWGQRLAASGVGLTTAALVLLMLMIANPAGELSAMERMVKAVREVTSFSFRLSNKMTVPEEDRRPWTVRDQNDITYWQAPQDPDSKWLGNLNAESKSRKFRSTESDGLDKGELSMHVKEVYPAGKPGILIDYVNKYYFRTLPALADEIREVSPIGWLRAVRDQTGEIVRDLGTRKIDGREAHGYIMSFKDAGSFPGFSPVEVWIDPRTDLPIEYYFQWEGWEEEEEGFLDEYRVTDCRWNIELDDKLFDTTPPEGFTNATWPREQAEIDGIVAALRLYADLSGGKYPELLKFDRNAVHRQMLENAGFKGPAQPSWAEDAKYRQIDEAMPALQRLADVLVGKWHTGYYAEKVTAHDKGKVLVWWPPDRPRKGYLVFYGDLRPEHVSGAKLVELEPATKGLVVLEDE